MILHAGLITMFRNHRWHGVLLLGSSGAGKSDLALRCLDHGFALVADDRCVLWTSGDDLYGAPPDSLAGLMEIRGLGIVSLPHRPRSRIVLAVECVTVERLERMPDSQTFEVLDRRVPRLSLACQEASAPAKLRHALIGLGVREQTA